MQNKLQSLYFKDFTYIPNILKEIYMDKVYEPFMRPNMTIVDIGANIGLIISCPVPQTSSVAP